MPRTACLLALSWLLAACAALPRSMPPDAVAVDIAFRSALTPEHNVDSLATWRGPQGQAWLIATAKASDRLLVYDARDGRLLRTVGESGSGDGQFRRPNGIFVIDDLAIVVERDNARVQVLELPSFRSLGSFGENVLRLPYGIWVDTVPAGWYRIYVTDDYRLADKEVPPLEALDQRVQVWQVRRRSERDRPAAGELRVRYARAFGPTEAPGALRVVESIWGDRANLNLLVAEEDESLRGTEAGLKLFTMDGHFKGRVVGNDVFQGQPEGIALWACDDGGGYWLAADQSPRGNRFVVFERRSFDYLGAFYSTQVSNSDGIWLHQRPIAGFDAGALFVVHDDQGVAAFDWRAIAAALDLQASCG
jgi:3-phytase